ncbi:MAG: 30S ribosomal protein S3 [Phycisphaerales bacterium]|jgi:small subunit ribosomal protein S3|nr:30S ribosomal protein S3 [Phycisphaerales bacterium]
MGQKTHPYGLRVGITEPHKSRWYAPKALFGELLVEDYKIRKFIDSRLNRKPPFAQVSDVQIERTREELKVIIRSARPGLVIGPKGAEVDRLTEELQYMTGRKVSIAIIEIKNPDMDAQLVGESVCEQLRKRVAFRRAMKMKADAVMQAGAKGIWIVLAGRLGGAEMSRTAEVRQGSLPLSTLQAEIDYGFAEAFMSYGAIGCKVWIFKGLYEAEKAEPAAEPVAAGGRTKARGRR